MENDYKPLYLQIKESIKENIISGKIKIGEKLPIEPMLCKTYGVSRVTLRQGMTQLHAEGLIEKFPGKGTFIVADRVTKKNKKVIKIILPDEPLSHQILLAAESILHQKGYVTIFTNIDAADFKTHIELGKKNDVGGYFVSPSFKGPSGSRYDQKIIRNLTKLRAQKIPFVLINRVLKKYRFDVVGNDSYTGGFLATKHLLEHGLKRIAYLSLPEHLENDARLLGYRDALQKYRIRKAIVKDVRLKKNVFGCKEVKELILGEKPQAIFAFNDWMVTQILLIAKDLGVKIPEELAVVGYDDINSSFVTPLGITSINQNLPQVACSAVELLLRRLDGDWSDFPQKIRVEPKLVVRQSCGCDNSK